MNLSRELARVVDELWLDSVCVCKSREEDEVSALEWRWSLE